MLRMLRPAAVAALIAVAPPAAALDGVAVTLGIENLRGEGTAPTLGVEYRAAPAWSSGGAAIGFAAASAIDTRGALWGGAGVEGRLPIGDQRRIEASTMPGISTRLGDRFRHVEAVLRSRISLGLDLPGGWSGSVGLSHRAGTRSSGFDPGVTLRLHREF